MTRLALMLILALASPAAAQRSRDDDCCFTKVEQDLPLAAVRVRAAELGVTLYFGGQAVAGQSTDLGTITSGPIRRTGTAMSGARALASCQEALFEAAHILAEKAKALGGNTVVAIDSGYAPEAASSGEHYLCANRPGEQPAASRPNWVQQVTLTGKAVSRTF